MPYPKDNAKMTGDTHLPDVESDMSSRKAREMPYGRTRQRATAARPLSAATRNARPAARARPAPPRGPESQDFGRRIRPGLITSAHTSSGTIPAQAAVARKQGARRNTIAGSTSISIPYNENSKHERIQRGNRPFHPPLDRSPVHLQDHPRPVAAVLQRPLHDDRPARQREAVAARLQHRQCQLRGAPGVPQHQGCGRPADLAPAAHQGGRQDHRRPQAHRHAAHRLPAAGQAAVSLVHRAPGWRRS